MLPKVEKGEILQILQRKNEDKTEGDIESLYYFFSSSVFLQKLAEKDGFVAKQAFFKSLKVKKYDFGTVLIRQNEIGSKAFALVEGTCTAYIDPEENVDKTVCRKTIDKLKEVGKITKGNIFGDVALLKKDVRLIFNKKRHSSLFEHRNCR